MGICSKWPLLVLMVVPLTFAGYGHRLTQSAPTTAQSSATNKQDNGAARILQAAEAWRAGDPLPEELRRFRQYGADIPTTLDSDSLMAEVKNPVCLRHLLSTRKQTLSAGKMRFRKDWRSMGPNKRFSSASVHFVGSDLSLKAACCVERAFRGVVHGTSAATIRNENRKRCPLS